MELHTDRILIVERRCSKFAAELLRDLRRHPKLPRLLAELEKMEGTIFRSDVEKLFFKLNTLSETYGRSIAERR